MDLVGRISLAESLENGGLVELGECRQIFVGLLHIGDRQNLTRLQPFLKAGLTAISAET